MEKSKEKCDICGAELSGFWKMCEEIGAYCPDHDVKCEEEHDESCATYVHEI